MDIFTPTKPPRLHIHPLPREFRLARIRPVPSQEGEPLLMIDAWMPKQWRTGSIVTNSDRNSDDFLDEYCYNCDLYCNKRTISLNDRHIDCIDISIEFTNGAAIDEGDVTEISFASPCPCHSEGLSSVDWPCPAGHDLQDYIDDGEAGEDSINLDCLRFSILLNARTLRPDRDDTNSPFRAALQDVTQDLGNGNWYITRRRRTLNTYDPSHAICWGSGTEEPINLAEAAETYANTPANEDLLHFDSYYENLNQMRRSEFLPEPLDGALAVPESPETRHAFALISSHLSLQTFLFLATAPNACIINSVAVIFLTWREDVPLPDGTTIDCWLSDAFPDGTRWLIKPDLDPDSDSTNGELLGQLQLPTNTPTPVCA